MFPWIIIGTFYVSAAAVSECPDGYYGAVTAGQCLKLSQSKLSMDTYNNKCEEDHPEARLAILDTMETIVTAREIIINMTNVYYVYMRTKT